MVILFWLILGKSKIKAVNHDTENFFDSYLQSPSTNPKDPHDGHASGILSGLDSSIEQVKNLNATEWKVDSEHGEYETHHFIEDAETILQDPRPVVHHDTDELSENVRQVPQVQVVDFLVHTAQEIKRDANTDTGSDILPHMGCIVNDVLSIGTVDDVVLIQSEGRSTGVKFDVSCDIDETHVSRTEEENDAWADTDLELDEEEGKWIIGCGLLLD